MLDLGRLTSPREVSSCRLEVGIVWFRLADGSKPVASSLCGSLSPNSLLKVADKTTDVLFKSGQVVLRAQNDGR